MHGLFSTVQCLSHLQSDLEEPGTSAYEIVFILLYLTKGRVSATSDHSSSSSTSNLMPCSLIDWKLISSQYWLFIPLDERPSAGNNLSVKSQKGMHVVLPGLK